MANASKAATGALSGAGTGFAVGGPIGAAIGGGVGLLGSLFDSGDSGQQEALAKAMDIYDNLDVATPEEREFTLEYLKKVGSLTPEMETAIKQGDTEMAKIAIDPKLKSAQMQALSNLSQQGKTGLTLEDRAGINDIKRDVAQQEKGQRDAVLQNMAARGMAGSGQELAAQLEGAQAGADRASKQNLDIAAQAQKARQQAVLNSGTLAGNMENQSFGEQSAIQRAQDAINQFNTNNAQNVSNANVTANNNAQKSNLDYAKELEQNRVATTNAQRQLNTNANLATIAEKNQNMKDKANIGVGQGIAADKNSANKASAYANLLGSGGALASSIANNNSSKAQLDQLKSDDELEAYKKAKGIV